MLNELKHRRIDVLKAVTLEELYIEMDRRDEEDRDIRYFSDTQLNNELTRRKNEAEKRYAEMMTQGLV